MLCTEFYHYLCIYMMIFAMILLHKLATVEHVRVLRVLRVASVQFFKQTTTRPKNLIASLSPTLPFLL